MSIYNLRKQLLAIFTQTCQLSGERYTGMVERLSDYHAGTNKHWANSSRQGWSGW
jgi:hypothetical protein